MVLFGTVLRCSLLHCFECFRALCSWNWLLYSYLVEQVSEFPIKWFILKIVLPFSQNAKIDGVEDSGPSSTMLTNWLAGSNMVVKLLTFIILYCLWEKSFGTVGHVNSRNHCCNYCYIFFNQFFFVSRKTSSQFIWNFFYQFIKIYNAIVR